MLVARYQCPVVDGLPTQYTVRADTRRGVICRVGAKEFINSRSSMDHGPWTMDHGAWTMDYWFPGILVQMSTVPHSVLPKTRLYSGGTPVVPGYSSMPSTSPGGMSSMLYPVTWMPSTKYWGGQFGLPLRAK